MQSQSFNIKLKHEAMKYVTKVKEEVKEGKQGSSYKAICKLGNRPGESWNRQEGSLSSYLELNFSPHEAAYRLTDYFLAITQTVEPLDRSKFSPSFVLPS